jgi:hypothetical protein
MGEACCSDCSGFFLGGEGDWGFELRVEWLSPLQGLQGMADTRVLSTEDVPGEAEGKKGQGTFQAWGRRAPDSPDLLTPGRNHFTGWQQP